MGNLTSTLTLQLVDDGSKAKALADAEAVKRLDASDDAFKKTRRQHREEAFAVKRHQLDHANAPDIISCVLAPPDWNAPPVVWPKSSRTIAREKAKVEVATRIAADAERLQRMVIPSLRTAAGRLWSMDVSGLLLIGPGGAIPVPGSAIGILTPLAAGGRHAEKRDRSAIDGLAPRLAAVGLRIDRRAAGVRIGKVR